MRSEKPTTTKLTPRNRRQIIEKSEYEYDPLLDSGISSTVLLIYRVPYRVSVVWIYHHIIWDLLYDIIICIIYLYGIYMAYKTMIKINYLHGSWVPYSIYLKTHQGFPDQTWSSTNLAGYWRFLESGINRPSWKGS